MLVIIVWHMFNKYERIVFLTDLLFFVETGPPVIIIRKTASYKNIPTLVVIFIISIVYFVLMNKLRNKIIDWNKTTNRNDLQVESNLFKGVRCLIYMIGVIALFIIYV